MKILGRIFAAFLLLTTALVLLPVNLEARTKTPPIPSQTFIILPTNPVPAPAENQPFHENLGTMLKGRVKDVSVQVVRNEQAKPKRFPVIIFHLEGTGPILVGLLESTSDKHPDFIWFPLPLNRDSEQFSALTNDQKAKMDGAIAAIQNTR